MNKGDTSIHRRGLVLVLSSPSGAGKTTISRAILKRDPQLQLSISVTTRQIRPGEIDGKDYYFVNKKKFDNMIKRAELLEYANVFGNFYGTPKKPVYEALSNGKDILFDIDWQGTQQLANNKTLKNDLVTVFILPPSTNELEKRLRSRAQDSELVVTQRMSKAFNEMSHYGEYKYVIVNGDIETSVESIHNIISAERALMDRQVGLHSFVQNLKK